MNRLARLVLASCAALAAFASLPRQATAAPLDFIPDAVLGKPSFTAGANGVVSATNMLWVSAIAEDPVSGELWVVDHMGSRVLRFASANAFTNGEAANLVLGQPDFVSDRANRGGAVAANTLNRPVGVAVDEARRVYVSDMENNRILVFHPPFANGMDARQVIGQPDFANAAPNRGGVPGGGTLNRPHGIALDASGLLWVADTLNARVLGYSSLTEPAPVAIRVIGQPDFQSVAPVLNATGMSQPAGVAIDSLGDLWVADQAFHRVTRYRRIEPIRVDRNPVSVLCQANFTSALDQVGDNGCFMPTGIAFTSGGSVIVADFGNHRLLDFGRDPAVGASASGVIGQADFSQRACNRGAAAPAANAYCGPRAIARDRHGNLLVADAGNGRVLRSDVPWPRNAPSLAGVSPAQLAAGSQGAALAVVGSNFYDDTLVEWEGQARPTRFISSRRLVVTLAPGDLSAPGMKSLRIITPSAVSGGEVIDPSAVEVVARVPGDPEPDRFLGVASLDFPRTTPIAPGAETVSGRNAAMLVGPESVAIDPVTGRLFVSEPAQSRVLSWPSYGAFTNAETADVVIGQPDGHSGGCKPVSASSLCRQGGIATDSAGRLYVADHDRHRVLRFDPPFATGMAAVQVFGQRGSFTTANMNAGGRGPDTLANPVSVAVWGDRLFIGDKGNERVLVFENRLADTTADAVLGRAGMAEQGSDKVVTASTLGGAIGDLAVDAQGALFVADGSRHRVLRFSAPFSNGKAADLVIGQQDFVSFGFGNTERTLRAPWGVAVDAEGNVLVADTSNNRVLRFSAPLANGMAARAVLGQPGLDSGDEFRHRGRVTGPRGVAVDPSGNVFVADTGNVRLLAFDRPFGVETSKRLVNIATRMPVLQGDDVLIGGFIIGGTAPKKVVVRARGPSLGAFGIANPLANPLLQLFSGANAIAANDNWQQAANVAEIQASGFAPAHPFESAILMTLDPGAYTAIVSGAGGVTGVGIVEVFEVDGAASPLVNIATRGRVLTGDDVLIGGFVISGDSPQTVVIRARGPSLAAAGVPNPLANPLLRLFAGDGTALLTNDDWTVAPNAVAIQASGFVPSDARESAILVTLNPGAYTAVVSGVGGTTGLAIVEVFVP